MDIYRKCIIFDKDQEKVTTESFLKYSKPIFLYIADRKKENSQIEADDIKDKEDLLKYLNEKYNVYHNMEFLQGLFLSCNAPKLYEICLKYARARGNDMRFFEKKILEEGKMVHEQYFKTVDKLIIVHVSNHT